MCKRGWISGENERRILNRAGDYRDPPLEEWEDITTDLGPSASLSSETLRMPCLRPSASLWLYMHALHAACGHPSVWACARYGMVTL